MSTTLVNLLIQIIGGAVGGNGVGVALKNLSLGTIGNTVVGGIGGAVGGQLLPLLLPMLSGGGNMDVGAIATQLVGGGVVGAVLTAVAGAVKNAMGGAKA